MIVLATRERSYILCEASDMYISVLGRPGRWGRTYVVDVPVRPPGREVC